MTHNFFSKDGYIVLVDMENVYMGGTMNENITTWSAGWMEAQKGIKEVKLFTNFEILLSYTVAFLFEDEAAWRKVVDEDWWADKVMSLLRTQGRIMKPKSGVKNDKSEKLILWSSNAPSEE